MKRLLTLLLVVSVGFNAGLAWRLADDGEDARAERSRRPRPWPALDDTQAWNRRVAARAEHMRRHLDLGPEQADAFADRHREAAREIYAQRRRVDDERARVRALILADTLDPGAVREAVADLGSRQAALDSLVAEKLLAEIAILGPDQRARLLRLLPLGDPPRPGGPHGHGHGRGRRHGGSGPASGGGPPGR